MFGFGHCLQTTYILFKLPYPDNPTTSTFHTYQGFINFFNHYLIGGVSEPLSSNFNEELLALLPILERGPPLGTLASDSDTE